VSPLDAAASTRTRAAVDGALAGGADVGGDA
jgi:hypothetical protein